MSEINPRDIKTVHTSVPEFPHLWISVGPISRQSGGVIGHSVGVMNENSGEGTRSGILFAEAEAKAVLKAIRKYRRQNPDAFSTES